MTTFKKIKKNKGFVILFAVTIAAILLSIALGVGNVTLKEVQFSTSAKDTTDALFSADSGIECALVNDKSTSNSFVTGTSPTLTCNNNNSILATQSPSSFWSFVVPGLDNSGQGCARVTVDKTVPSKTAVVAKGYNNRGGVAGACNPGPNAVERELDTNYTN